jgi:uncharacterized membrane protein YuzA (DUF378 family)
MISWKKVAFVLANIGALNWGLAQLNWNLVDNLIGSWSLGTAKVVYYVVALCGIYGLYAVFKK